MKKPKEKQYCDEVYKVGSAHKIISKPIEGRWYCSKCGKDIWIIKTPKGEGNGETNT
jgi:hypothetical protein